MHGLFFEVAHESVREFRCGQIHKEVHIEKYGLGCRDRESGKYTRVPHAQENEEVHSLVFGLLEQVMDPAIVLFESS